MMYLFIPGCKGTHLGRSGHMGIRYAP